MLQLLLRAIFQRALRCLLHFAFFKLWVDALLPSQQQPWCVIFLILIGIVIFITGLVFFFLPEGHEPDPTVQLNARSIAKEFAVIMRTPVFFTYCLSGAFSFAGLFIYLAGAPDLFLTKFNLSEKTFGIIFAGLSVGMVGGGQFNIFLSRFFSSERIYKTAIKVQLGTALIFLLGSAMNWYDLYSHILILFIFISCVGLLILFNL